MISTNRLKRAQITLLCLILTITATSSFQAAESRRYLKGELLTYPPGTQPIKSFNEVLTATPTLKRKIRGTIRSEFSEEFNSVDFLVYFRDDDGTSYKESLIFEFSAPFKLHFPYQDQDLLYISDHPEAGFDLDEAGLKLFKLDPDFYTFRGEEVANNLKLKTLKLKMKIDKETVQGDKGQRSTRYKPTFSYFEFSFESNKGLEVLKIDIKSMDEGTVPEFFSMIFIILVPGLFVFLQNVVIQVFSGALQMSKHLGMFLFTLTYAIMAPFTFILLARYMEGFLWTFLVIVLSFATYSMNVTTIMHLCKSFSARQEPAPNGSQFLPIFVAGMIFSIAWIVLLIFFYWLILRSYFFFALMMLLDYARIFLVPRVDKEKMMLPSILTAVRGLFLQFFIYSIYFLVFYKVHLHYPPIFYPTFWLILYFLLFYLVSQLL